MTTAVGIYATLAEAKGRGIGSGGNDDARIQLLCDQVNGWIEAKTGRIFAPITYSASLFNGTAALEAGRLLLVPRGLRTVSLLRLAFFTGGAMNTIPSTDYFIQPASQERDPGWPGTELWMSDIPSSNPCPTFQPGINTIEVTGTGGWAFPPDEIVDVALNLVISQYRALSSGGGDSLTIGIDGERTFERALSGKDYSTIKLYSLKQLDIV